MITYKLKYRHYIVNLYLPEQYSGARVVLLPGLPMSTNVQKLIQTFLDTGAIVYYPYFSGTFDSGGRFSASQSMKDVTAFHSLAQISKVTELYFGKELDLGPPSETILVGMSYSAAIALLGHSNVYQKIILLSPALLFNAHDISGTEGKSFHEQMISLVGMLKRAYMYSYRMGLFSDLKSFLLGHKARKNEIVVAFNKVSCPVLVMHGTQDSSIPVTITQSIENDVTNKNVRWEYVDAGHSTSSYGEDSFSLIQGFLKQSILP